MVTQDFSSAFLLRLFSASHPPSVRRQHALLALAGYLALASLTLSLAEEWHPVDAAYFVSATVSTIGCGDVAPRSLLGKLMACTLSIAGPLAAAVFWRDARARPVPSHKAKEEGRGRPAFGTLDSLDASDVRHLSGEAEGTRETRISDAVWAFVGVLMAVATCAGVFLKVPRRSSGETADGEGRDVGESRVETTLIDAVYDAFMTLATVGPADAPFSELSSLGRRAAMIPAMLAGAMIFSRSMWALVDLLIPPTFEVAPASRAFCRRSRAALSSLSSPMLSRFGGRSGEGARGSSAVGVWRDFAAVGSPIVSEGKATTAAAGFAGRHPRASTQRRQEREADAPAKKDNPERLRVEGRETVSGREGSALTSTRWRRPPPPSPSLPPTVAFVDSDDEDEGWVSEEGLAVSRGPRDVCDEVDGRSQEDAPEAGGDGGGEDPGGDAFRKPYLGNDAAQGIHQGGTSLDLDGAPRGVRSWEAGSIRRNQSARRQKEEKGGADGAGGSPGGRRLDSRWEGNDRDTDKDEEITTGSNHRGSLDSVEEVDEDAGGSSNFVLGKSGWRQAPRLHEGKGDPVSIDEFIVKKLLEQGKLGRMEAAQMMLEFEQTAARRRRASSSTSSTACEHAGPKGKEHPKSQRQGGGEDQTREGGDSVARKSSSRNTGLDEPAGASQDSTANASAVAPDSHGGRATGLASLEIRQRLGRALSASRSLRPAGDILPAHSGERVAPRRRGDEGVPVVGIDADAPSNRGSPIYEPLLPPPGL